MWWKNNNLTLADREFVCEECGNVMNREGIRIYSELIKYHMGLTYRKKSGNKLNGSRLNVPGQGISNVRPSGDNKINQQKVVHNGKKGKQN